MSVSDGSGPHRPTGWAILGTGVVARKFVQGLGPLKGAARVVAVASRDPRNAERFVRDLGLACAVTDYAAAVALPGVDAVYVATPPSEHEAHALLAIAAGRAVLVEKPFAMDAAAARRIAEAATTADVFCMEAMWTRFLPLLQAVRQRLTPETLGEIRSFHGSFHGSDHPDPAASVFDPARGGGALLHRGIYPVSLARHLLGPIVEVTARGRIGATGVDEDCALILRHASGAISTISASLRAPGANSILIAGTHGMLEIRAPVYRPFQAHFSRTMPRKAQSGKIGRLGALRESGLAQGLNQAIPQALRGLLQRGETLNRPFAGNGYHYEAAEVARCLAQGLSTSSIMPLSESIEIMAVIDAARAQFK